jgi:serine/threonine-protein kinase
VSLTPPFLLLDRYDVSAQIGRGGHAIVYRAHDRVFDRAVAIKLLRDDALSPDVLARFRQEIQLTARLEHAHILHVYDTGTFEGLPFVVMELASGQTLADRLAREGPLPVADALQITRDVGLALAHAHARGIVHRDVKPENILLGSGGAMLADFGVARVTADQAVQRLTSTGMAVGTLQYMSPEQLCAEPQIDHRSDQYALACVLYEMLAGVRPHASASLEGLRMLRLTGQQAPVSSHRPSVPAAVEEALQVALAVAPADRFRSVEAFLRALDVLRTLEPSGRTTGSKAFTPTSARAPVTAPALRWRTMAVAGAAVVASVFGISRWLAARSDDSGPMTPDATVIALAPVSDAVAGAVRERLRAELSAWSGLAVQDGSVRRGVQVMTAVTPLGDSVQLRLDLRDSAGAEVRQVRRLLPARVLDRSASPAAAAAIASLAREVLAGRRLDSLRGIETIPTRSLSALRAFVRGTDLLRVGQLDSATAAFRAARDAAPGFAAAHLWAAQSAAWGQPKQGAAWQADADAALRMRGLDSGLTLLAQALGHMARRAYPDACAAYRDADRVDAVRFEALVGLGECQRLDDLVVRTPAGLRFRSSHWAALQAYTKAVDVAPTSELLAVLMPRMRRMTYATGTDARMGTRDGAVFYALTSTQSDTLEHLPISKADFVSGDPRRLPATFQAATLRGRELDVRLTRRWADRHARSAEAWLQHGLALEGAGRVDLADSAGALWAAERADRLGLPERLRVDAALLRTRAFVRTGDFAGATRHVRSVLSGARAYSSSDSLALASLAAFARDGSGLRRWWRQDSVLLATVPSVLTDSLGALERSVLLGNCPAVRTQFERVDSMIQWTVARASIVPLRRQFVIPVLRRALPCLGIFAFRGVESSQPLDEVVAALIARDRVRAIALLRAIRDDRRGASVAAVTWDQQYLESWARAEAGDTLGALSNIIDALDGITSMSVSTLSRVPQASGLRLSLGLLTQLASTPSLSEQDQTRLATRVAHWVAMTAALE